jgi:hypothetical protein
MSCNDDVLQRPAVLQTMCARGVAQDMHMAFFRAQARDRSIPFDQFIKPPATDGTMIP